MWAQAESRQVRLAANRNRRRWYGCEVDEGLLGNVCGYGCSALVISLFRFVKGLMNGVSINPSYRTKERMQVLEKLD